MADLGIPSIKLSLPVNGFKKTIGQFFSEFTNIAPDASFDRPERSLSMRLYTLDKRSFLFVFLAFVASIFLAIFIGLSGPEITLTKEIDASSLPNSTNNDFFAEGPFVIKSQQVGTYSRQIWLFAKYKIVNTESETFDTGFDVCVQISGYSSVKSQFKILDEFPLKNRTRHLKCNGNVCEDFTILHIGWIDYSRYEFSVKFYGLNHKRYNISNLKFYIKTFNPAFTSLEISFRFIFLFFVFIVTCWFYHALRKHPSTNWSIEQKFTYVLLPLLILFDNPIYPLQFLVNSMFVGMLDALFQATFLCGLLLFWVTVYHALRQNNRKFLTFYLAKLLILSPIFLCALTLAIWEKCSELKDPTYIHFVDGNYSGFKTFFYISVVIYLIYLMILVLSAYGDLASLQFFDMRLKFLSLLMVFVMGFTLWSTLSRFGGMGIVEDNFVGQLATSYKSSAHFMAFYGMINFYVITMSYVYSPSQSNNEPVRKDNPTFSMINDSDEDVIYGSEDDSRRPLNSTNKTNEYDSD